MKNSRKQPSAGNVLVPESPFARDVLDEVVRLVETFAGEQRKKIINAIQQRSDVLIDDIIRTASGGGHFSPEKKAIEGRYNVNVDLPAFAEHILDLLQQRYKDVA